MDMYLTLFLISTLWIGPFWIAMLLKPNNIYTLKLVEGPLFFIGPLLIWFFIFIVDFNNISKFSLAFESSNTLIECFAMGLANKTGFTATWAHVVVGDIFVTRWIWKRSLNLNLEVWPIRLSVFFGVMLMPLGLLLHLLFVKIKKNRLPKFYEV